MAHGKTRDLRVLWALEEMGLPYEVVGMDHPAHDLDSAAYRALNPFGQIPVIDDDGVVVTESGAILLYLARKSGKLMPRDLAGEAQVLRWCVAALNTIELPLLTLLLMGFVTKDDEPPMEFAAGWAKRHLGNLDRWLDGREFVATDAFTVADILMAHALDEVKDRQFMEPYPRVASYRERCFARPAWKRTLESYLARVEAT